MFFFLDSPSSNGALKGGPTDEQQHKFWAASALYSTQNIICTYKYIIRIHSGCILRIWEYNASNSTHWSQNPSSKRIPVKLPTGFTLIPRSGWIAPVLVKWSSRSHPKIGVKQFEEIVQIICLCLFWWEFCYCKLLQPFQENGESPCLMASIPSNPSFNGFKWRPFHVIVKLRRLLPTKKRGTIWRKNLECRQLRLHTWFAILFGHSICSSLTLRSLPTISE